jgi:hypothetical protein
LKKIGIAWIHGSFLFLSFLKAAARLSTGESYHESAGAAWPSTDAVLTGTQPAHRPDTLAAIPLNSVTQVHPRRIGQPANLRLGQLVNLLLGQVASLLLGAGGVPPFGSYKQVSKIKNLHRLGGGF